MNLNWPWNLIVVVAGLAALGWLWVWCLGYLFREAVQASTSFRAGGNVLLLLVVAALLPLLLWVLVA